MGASTIGELGSSELGELVALAERFQVAGGDLFRQGDIADSMYALEDGEVELVARTPGDEIVLLGRAGAGAVFGELSLIDRGVRSATARVTKPASGWRLGQHAFQMLRAARRPSSAALLSRLVSITCDRIRGRVADVRATLDRAAPPVFRATPSVDPERWAPMGEPELDARLASMLPFFRRLSREGARALFAAGSVWEVARGERLAIGGAPAEAIFVVIRGAVASWVERDERRERCGLASPGRVVSTVAAMDGGPSAFDAAAREASVVLRIEHGALRALRSAGTEVSHAIEDALVEELTRELRVVTAQVARLAAHGRLPLRV